MKTFTAAWDANVGNRRAWQKRHEIATSKVLFIHIQTRTNPDPQKKHQLPADLSGEKSGGHRCLNQFSRCRSGTSSHLAICS